MEGKKGEEVQSREVSRLGMHQLLTILMKMMGSKNQERKISPEFITKAATAEILHVKSAVLLLVLKIDSHKTIEAKKNTLMNDSRALLNGAVFTWDKNRHGCPKI